MFIKIASLFSAIFVVLVSFTWTDSAQEMVASIRQLQEIISSSASNNFSNDITTSTTVALGPFYLILTPVNGTLTHNATDRLLWILDNLIKHDMQKKYSHGFGSDFQQMSPLEISSITYDVNERRHLLNDEYHHHKIPAKRKQLENVDRELFTISSAKVNIESIVFFFEGNWIDDSLLPSVSDVQDIISGVVTSESFTGTLKLTTNPQLQQLESVEFGYEVTQFPTIKPTKTLTNPPTNFPTKKPQSQPTGQPSIFQSNHPSSSPTDHLSFSPTDHPTSLPTSEPTSISTFITTSISKIITPNPTSHPTSHPTSNPTSHPTNAEIKVKPLTPKPTIQSTSKPSLTTTNSPTDQSSSSPSNPKIVDIPESTSVISSLNEDVGKQRKIPIVAITSSVAFLVIVVLFLFLLKRQKRRRKQRQAFRNHGDEDEDLEFAKQDSLSPQKLYSYPKKNAFSPSQSSSNSELYTERIEHFMNSEEFKGDRNFVLHKDMFCLNDDPSSTGAGMMLYGGSLGDPRQIETPKKNVLQPSHFRPNDIQSIRSSSSSDDNMGDFEFAPDDTWDPDDAIEDDHSQSFVESPASSSSITDIRNLIESPTSFASIKDAQRFIIGSSTSMSSKSGHGSYLQSPSSTSSNSHRNLNMSYSSETHGSYRMQMLDLDDMKEENIIL